MSTEKLSDIVIVDFETTGLGPDKEPWEWAALKMSSATGWRPDIRSGLIKHDVTKAAELPEPFRTLHATCYDESYAMSREEAAHAISDFLGHPADRSDRVHFMGMVPSFDSDVLTALLAEFGLPVEWHYHLIDLETLAVGWLARGLHEDMEYFDPREILPPFSSDRVSELVGVTPPGVGDRHTALGDVIWGYGIFRQTLGTVYDAVVD